MAFYNNAPKKKKKTDYADRGAWEEEGSSYRNHSSKSGRYVRDAETAENRSEGRGKRVGRKPLIHDAYHENTYRSQDENNHMRNKSETFSEEKNGKRSYSHREYRSSLDRNDRNGTRKPRQTRSMIPDESNGRSREYFRNEEPEDRMDYRKYEYNSSAFAQPHEDDQENILCGRNPIREALRSGREIEKLLVQKGELSGSAREIVQEARSKKIMVQEVDKRRLDDIALHHQGLIAFASAYQYASVEDILKTAEERQEAPFIIILDSVTDPHNFGAVIRTAECAGAHGVIVPLHRSVGLTPAAVKASAGAIEHIAVARVTNLNRTIDDLKKKGVWIYAVTMDGKDFEKVEFQEATALVIGAEGEGISRLTAEKCDLSVSLPMKGSLDSLNASVAAGIVMYRVLSSRRNHRG